MIKNNISLAERIISLIDLTNLNETATVDGIKELCQKAQIGVAAICIYPEFIPLAKRLLKNSTIRIATVCNFPKGNAVLADVLAAIVTAKTQGVAEIDVVTPYQDHLAGNTTAVKKFITACKTACGDNIILKVILETGILQQPEIIAQASRDAILAGADFIKTSTGKISSGATLEAAAVMLQEIRKLKLNRAIGFKASGGIRTIAQATEYLQLADSIMGANWATPETFRFGASSLLDEIIAGML